MHQRINTCKVNKSAIKPNQRTGKNYNTAFALFLHNSVTQFFLQLKIHFSFVQHSLSQAFLRYED